MTSITIESLFKLLHFTGGHATIHDLVSRFDVTRPKFYLGRFQHEDGSDWTVPYTDQETLKVDLRTVYGEVEPFQIEVHQPAGPYTTSVDAIFAAEARLGLHANSNYLMAAIWQAYALQLLRLIDPSIEHADAYKFAFLEPHLRSIPFILTAQWLENR